MKKNIALFISYLDNEFSMDIIDGAWLAAEDFDVNLFIFPTRLIVDNYANYADTRFEYQYNTLFSYGDRNNFDGIIVETGVICNGMKDAEVKKLFKQFGNIPVISIARKIENYPNISFNVEGLREEIAHLITTHHCKRIGFIGGPVNNMEAQQRLEVYKQTLEEYDIPFDANLVGMGNFSEFCVNEVDAVLRRNAGNIDALCFANDRMAIGGYKAIQALGLTVGKDIKVTGFDDAPSASVMHPMLTTVRSNVSTLGYRAISRCIEMMKGSKNQDDVSIDTSMIVRSSCGCPSKAHVFSEKFSDLRALEAMSIRDFCDELQAFLSTTLNCETTISREIQTVTDAFYDLLTECQCEDFNSEKCNELLMDAIKQIDFETLPYNEFSYMLRQVRRKAAFCAYDNKKTDEFFLDLSDHIVSNLFAESYKARQSYRDSSLMTNWIVHDVLSNIMDEDQSYFSIIRNIHRHGSQNCFLFIHEFPIVCRSYATWHRPRTERLVCYQCGDQEILIPHEEQSVPTNKLFRVPQFPKGRHTYICSPLFYDTEQFGLLLCEMNRKDYTYLGWFIGKQISYALKTKQLMEKQLEEQEKLFKSMEAISQKNEQLKKTSISDEMTGLYNRRGFIEIVSEQLRNPINLGKHTVIAFADMNYLKTINDRFGHDEGDFAIRGAAEILTRCFRNGDIVARFGGDEFAAFCFTEPDCNFESLYRKRLQRTTDMFNEACAKPYLITLSTGIFEFTCKSNLDVTECLNIADDLLYEDKKKKPKTVIRDEITT